MKKDYVVRKEVKLVDESQEPASLVVPNLSHGGQDYTLMPQPATSLLADVANLPWIIGASVNWEPYKHRREWTLLEAAFLMLELEPPMSAIGDITRATRDIIESVPPGKREELSHIYGLSKEYEDVLAWWPRTPPGVTRYYRVQYVDRDVYVSWAKQVGISIPAELSTPSVAWIHPTTHAIVSSADCVTKEWIVRAYRSRIEEGAKFFNRIFERKSGAPKESDPNPTAWKPKHVNTLVPVKKWFVRALVDRDLEHRCSRPKVSVYPAGQSGRSFAVDDDDVVRDARKRAWNDGGFSGDGA